jgi:hypothetical protein
MGSPGAAFAVGRLRTGEWLAAIGGVLALVSLFALHWYEGAINVLVTSLVAHHGFIPRPPGVDGWDAMPTLRWFVLVAAVLGLVAAIAQATSRGPALPVTLDLVAMLVAGLTTILVAIRLATSDAPLRFGAVLGVFSVALVAAGAYQAMRAEQGWTPGPERPIELVELSSETH